MRAERVRFELTVQLAATQLISSQLPSATRAPLRVLMQIASKPFESFLLFMLQGLQPSFAEKDAAKRVGFQNEGSAPGEDGDEPPDLALLAKVRAIKERAAEVVE